MSLYYLRRALYSLMSVVGVLVIVFFVQRLTGDPALLFASDSASKEQVEALRIQMGLDRPVWYQFLLLMKGAATGDFGYSYGFGQSALSLVLERMPATIELAGTSMLIAVILGGILGVTAGLKPGSNLDMLSSTIALIGQSTPTFWVGLMLILLFGVVLRVLPTSGAEEPRYLILPAITLALYSTASIARLLRTAIMEVMGEDYIRTARAKGLAEKRVLLFHALKNAAIPVVTIIALETGTLLSGAVITETVFAWPGVGRLMVQAVSKRDYPLVQAIVFVFALIFVTTNFLADVVYSHLDPRIRYE